MSKKGLQKVPFSATINMLLIINRERRTFIFCDYCRIYNNINKMQNQEEYEYLLDTSASGKVRNWKDYKLKNELLAIAYQNVNKNKSARLRECSTTLIFNLQNDGSKRLKTANFCRVRLCPVCTWRRSLQIFAQMKKIMEYLKAKTKYKYIFLTLTDKNCDADNLIATMDNMFKAFNLFTKRKDIKRMCKGYFRSMEITHDTNEYITKDMWNGNKEKHIYARKEYYKKRGLNVGDKNPNFDKFHVHFHIIIAVDSSYFTDKKKYLSQSDITEIWQSCLNVTYTPVVDVRRIKGDTVQAICETAKYTVKSDDYIVPDDWDLTENTVAILDKALNNRRLVAYGGIFREVHKKLNLQDLNSDNIDLINIDEQEPTTGKEKEIFYYWDTGFKNYLKEF